MSSLLNHVALVTGASRGIGKVIALELAKQGCNLALLGRDQKALAATAEQCSAMGRNVLPVIADVTDRNTLHKAVDAMLTHFGQINFMINNHGISKFSKLLEDKDNAWEQVIDVNLKASIYLTKLILPSLLQAPKNTQRALIYIASIAARINYAGGNSYAPSKHGLLSFANCLFDEIREEGVKVCSICPGYVNTSLVAGRGLVAEKMIQPQDVADSVLYLLNSPATCCPTEIYIRPQRSPYCEAAAGAVVDAC